MCVCVCVYVCVYVYMCVCVCVYSCIISAPYYTVICGLSGSTIFFHIIAQTVQHSGKKVIEHKKYMFWFSVQILPEHFSFLEELDT